MDYNKPKTEYVDPRDYSAEQVQEFLKKIRMIESSGGKNLDHPEISSGLHSGTSATGEYALMPATAQDIDRQSGANELKGLSKEEVQARLEQDPELNKLLSETMASKLLRKNPDEASSYKWLHGQYSNPSKSELEKSPRVKAFRSLKNMDNKK